jgi:hypothetical protein
MRDSTVQNVMSLAGTDRYDVAGFDQRVIRIIDGHKVLLDCISASLSVVDGAVKDVLCCDN